jgi:hypothetical protein
MLLLGAMNRPYAIIVTSVALTCSCAADDAANSLPPDSSDQRAPQPPIGSTFSGSYRVPVVDTKLSAAARFDIAKIDWGVTDGIAKLDYDLPAGLVGGTIKVELVGAYDASTGTARLAGELGTADCTASATKVECREVFTGLGALPISMDTVTRLAQREYNGAVKDRVDVVLVFGSDPIGIAEVNLLAPRDK